jgi:hypothetical protein
LDFRQFRQYRLSFSKTSDRFLSVLAVVNPSREKAGFASVTHERASIDLGHTKRYRRLVLRRHSGPPLDAPFVFHVAQDAPGSRYSPPALYLTQTLENCKQAQPEK